MAAQMNNMRIDFLRPQRTHVLKANITELNRISGSSPRSNVGSYARMIVWQKHEDLHSKVKVV